MRDRPFIQLHNKTNMPNSVKSLMNINESNILCLLLLQAERLNCLLQKEGRVKTTKVRSKATLEGMDGGLQIQEAV